MALNSPQISTPSDAIINPFQGVSALTNLIAIRDGLLAEAIENGAVEPDEGQELLTPENMPLYDIKGMYQEAVDAYYDSQTTVSLDDLALAKPSCISVFGDIGAAASLAQKISLEGVQSLDDVFKKIGFDTMKTIKTKDEELFIAILRVRFHGLQVVNL